MAVLVNNMHSVRISSTSHRIVGPKSLHFFLSASWPLLVNSFLCQMISPLFTALPQVPKKSWQLLMDWNFSKNWANRTLSSLYTVDYRYLVLVFESWQTPWRNGDLLSYLKVDVYGVLRLSAFELRTHEKPFRKLRAGHTVLQCGRKRGQLFEQHTGILRDHFLEPYDFTTHVEDERGCRCLFKCSLREWRSVTLL